MCAVETPAKEVLSPARVNEMFERDFHERLEDKDQQSLSVVDREFLEILDKGIHKGRMDITKCRSLYVLLR